VHKRGSPAQALIEFVFRFRLHEGIAHKALLIENDGPGVVLLPRRRPSRRGDPRGRRGLADVAEDPLRGGRLGAMKATMPICVPHCGQVRGNAS
jgi:hypothetical protein